MSLGACEESWCESREIMADEVRRILGILLYWTDTYKAILAVTIENLMN